MATRLYEKRTAVYPKAVDGTFRRLKWVIMAVTLTIYYVTPWLRWDRGPYAPDQAVLIDLADRRFYMFGIEIWPHEFYYVAGPADHGRDRPVPGHLRGRPRLVRLCLPADRLDRPLPACRALHRRRPQRPDPARPRALGAGQDRPARRQIFGLAG